MEHQVLCCLLSVFVRMIKHEEQVGFFSPRIFIVLLNIPFQALRPMITVIHGPLKIYLSKTNIKLA